METEILLRSVREGTPIDLGDHDRSCLYSLRDILGDLHDLCQVSRVLWIMSGLAGDVEPIATPEPVAAAINSLDLQRLPDALGTQWACCEHASRLCVARLLRTNPVSRPLPTTARETATTVAPVRIDLAGGWTDTPPISLETSGAVLNAAILVDGVHPIRCDATLKSSDGPKIIATERSCYGTTIRQLASLDDFRNIDPSVPLAVAKGALVVAGVVDPQSDQSLESQIEQGLPQPYNSIHLRTECMLPTGTGLGVSSIVAASILDAIARTRGAPYPDESALFRDVLYLEQVIGCGGGWQDQVGGIIGGVKVTQWAAGLKEVPSVQPLNDSATLSVLQRMCLIHTGKQRISKGAVDATIDRWHGRDPQIVQTVTDLFEGVEMMRVALQSDSAPDVGSALSHYWKLKKQMVGTEAEPEGVTLIMRAVSPRLQGWSIAGAGGGGYVVAVMQDDESIESIRSALSGFPDCHVVPFALAETGLIRQ